MRLKGRDDIFLPLRALARPVPPSPSADAGPSDARRRGASEVFREREIRKRNKRNKVKPSPNPAPPRAARPRSGKRGHQIALNGRLYRCIRRKGRGWGAGGESALRAREGARGWFVCGGVQARGGCGRTPRDLIPRTLLSHHRHGQRVSALVRASPFQFEPTAGQALSRLIRDALSTV